MLPAALPFDYLTEFDRGTRTRRVHRHEGDGRVRHGLPRRAAG